MAMKFASFEAKDTKGINDFLARNEKYLGSNGAYVFEKMVHFMWLEQTDDEAKRFAIVEEIKKKLVVEETSVALQQVEVNHAREEAKRGEKGADHKVVEAEGMLAQMRSKVGSVRKVMAAVLAGEYDL